MALADTRELTVDETTGGVEAIGDPTNGGAASIVMTVPYIARITVVGTSPFLFHRWNNEAVAEKAAQRKGSTAKKTDDVESYVYRAPNGNLAIPGEYFRMGLIGAAKYRQDPRSPRKSAMDLYKAAVAVMDEYCDIGQANWDYLDRRRVVIQRSGVTRVRPALLPGWKATMVFQVLLPDYINQAELNDTIQNTGKLIGVGDFRPTFGRFQVVGFEVEAAI